MVLITGVRYCVVCDRLRWGWEGLGPRELGVLGVMFRKTFVRLCGYFLVFVFGS